jgi:hypothetical protein
LTESRSNKHAEKIASFLRSTEARLAANIFSTRESALLKKIFIARDASQLQERTAVCVRVATTIDTLSIPVQRAPLTAMLAGVKSATRS